MEGIKRWWIDHKFPWFGINPFKGLVIDDEQDESLLLASALEENPKHNNGMPKNVVRIDKLFDL